MTAYDEAIEAMLADEKAYGQKPFGRPYYESLLNAIPDAVLARLAIDRGGLVETNVYEPELQQLYRLTEDPQ